MCLCVFWYNADCMCNVPLVHCQWYVISCHVLLFQLVESIRELCWNGPNMSPRRPQIIPMLDFRSRRMQMFIIFIIMSSSSSSFIIIHLTIHVFVRRGTHYDTQSRPCIFVRFDVFRKQKKLDHPSGREILKKIRGSAITVLNTVSKTRFSDHDGIWSMT